MKTVYRNLLVYSLCIGLIFAPVHYARAIFPAIGSVVTGIVGVAVTEAGTTALVNVVAGKSPWGASDNVFGGKVKIPIKSIGDWVKKQGKSVGFWTAAMLLAGFFMDADNTVSRVPDSASVTICYPSPGLNLTIGSRAFGACLNDAIAKQQQMYASASTKYKINFIGKPKPAGGGYDVTYAYLYFPDPSVNSGNGFNVIVRYPTYDDALNASKVPDADWDKFVADSLSKVGYGDNPFTPSGQQYPVYPVDGQTWPTTVTPVTPPMTPNKPWPTPVPSPQPIPTPDNPTFPAVPDDAWKPFPLPDHTGVKPVDPPVTNPGTEVKPLPDGGFVIPNPLPVTVDGPVDVNILNPLEQGLTLKQLTNYHDTAAGSLTEAPAIGTGDGISELGKAYDDLIKNKMNFSIPSLPSPYSHFNFDMGSCRLPSFSASILGDVKRIQVNSEFCTFYDGVGRPVVAWMFFMLTVLYIYLLTMRTVRAQ